MRRDNSQRRWLRNSTSSVAILVLLTTGCAEDNPFATQPISGKVTYENGKPIGAAMVTVHFIPDRSAQVGGKFPQPGQATLNADGTFAEAATFAPGDGAIPGRHKVVLEAMNADYSPHPSAIAAQFLDPAQTPLSVEVKAGEPNHFEFIVLPGGGS